MEEFDAEQDRLALSHQAWEGLLAAAADIAELLKNDLRALQRGDSATCSAVVALMPRRFFLKYDGQFAEQLQRTADDLRTRLCRARDEGWDYPYETFLNSVAEELLMLHVILLAVENAESPLTAEELKTLQDVCFEDRDFEWLYDLSQDGITEDPRISEKLGFANLGFGEWFQPFR